MSSYRADSADVLDDDILTALAVEGLGGSHSACQLILGHRCGSDHGETRFGGEGAGVLSGAAFAVDMLEKGGLTVRWMGMIYIATAQVMKLAAIERHFILI